MRYIMLLLTLAVVGVLVYLQFAGKPNRLSPLYGAQKMQEVRPQLEQMQSDVNRYNRVIQDAQEKTDSVLK